jgi:biopolymer transport protein ExbD
MAMTTGAAQINMTPMIDILLVLIIIFMVITPIVPRGLDAAIPQEDQASHPDNLPSRDVVINVAKDGRLAIDQESIEDSALGPRLSALFRLGGTHHLFVRGDRDLEFQAIVHVIDVARGAGWDRVGLMTR